MVGIIIKIKRATKQAGPMKMGCWYLTHHLKKVIGTIA